MTLVKVGALAALLSLTMAGTAAASCGDAVADAVCMTQDLVFGPSGLVPFTTHQVDVLRAFVDQLLPTIIIPLGGLL